MRRIIKGASSASVVALLALTACSDDKDSTDTQPPIDTTVDSTTGEAPAGGVTIGDFAFDTGAGVTAGEEFTVTNNDRTAHTFSEVGGAFTIRVDGDSSDTLTIDAPGSYQVVCQIHPTMTGTLTVN